MSDGHLLLLDASGFIHRSFHSGNPTYRSDGLPTWAITGFMALCWKLLGAAQHDQPTHAAAVFDAPGKTFRHQLFPAYKSNRPARDQELAPQLPYIRLAAQAMGLVPVEAPGFEADDLLATLAHRAAGQGMRVTVVSSDKDMGQTVQLGLVDVLDPVSHVRGLKFGVEPHQVPDYQALAGDAVDNIPGIDGIGDKSAAALVRLFGTVEEIVAAVKTAPNFFTPNQRVRLKAPGTLERLQLYRTLATLRRDVPLEIGLDDLVLKPIIREAVDAILKKLEATGRFEQIFASAPQMQRVVEPLLAAAEDWWNEELVCPGQPVPDLPQVGCYERRLAKGGVFEPAIIWRESEFDPITGERTGMQILRCQVGEMAADPFHEWPRLCRSPIEQSKYDFEMADRRWATVYATDDPKLKPQKPVDFYNLKPPTFSKPDSQKRKTAR